MQIKYGLDLVECLWLVLFIFDFLDLVECTFDEFMLRYELLYSF